MERRNAIVTGAASGLGRALAVGLGREGWCVALADVNRPGCEETLRLVKQGGGDGFVEEIDVRHIEEWQALRDRLKARWDHLDLLVNNAGVAGSGLVGEYPIENWQWIIDVNLWNGINGCHTFVDWLKANPRAPHHEHLLAGGDCFGPHDGRLQRHQGGHAGAVRNALQRAHAA